jgi:uncharacterized protein
MTSKLFLGFEFFLLCVILPTIIIVFQLASYMLLFLWAACAFCWLMYRRYHYEDLRKLWEWQAVTWENLKPVLIRWVICSTLMLVFIWIYDPDRMFGMLRRNPAFVPWLMILYPALSALPQEFIFCTFFFERYAVFFKTDKARITASAIVFAYAHILFINPVAPVLSFVGGLIFAGTFAKTRSLALVTIEHGLYGNVLFLTGLGWYFWHGALTMMH